MRTALAIHPFGSALRIQHWYANISSEDPLVATPSGKEDSLVVQDPCRGGYEGEAPEVASHHVSASSVVRIVTYNFHYFEHFACSSEKSGYTLNNIWDGAVFRGNLPTLLWLLIKVTTLFPGELLRGAKGGKGFF